MLFEAECTSKQKYLQLSRCDYELTKSDLKEIDTFAKELDTIEADLAEIQDHIESYKKSYLVYCDNLVRFIDQKELLMSMFLGYYDEYFIRRKNVKPMKHTQRHVSENISSGCPKTRNRKVCIFFVVLISFFGSNFFFWFEYFFIINLINR